MMLERLLWLWRDRWGLATPAVPTVALTKPPARPVGQRLARWSVWDLPGVPLLSMLIASLLLLAVIGLELSLAGQAWFAAALLVTAIYLSRHRGFMANVMILVLSFIATARYFVWRFEATIPRGLGMEHWIGWLECVAELFLCLWVALLLLRAAWPLEHPQRAMPGIRQEWPMVDFVLRCGECSLSEVEQGLRSILELDWPAEKTHVFVYDDAERADVRELARRWGCGYLAPTADRGHEDWLIAAASASRGAFLVTLDGHDRCAPGFLRAASAWMLFDMALALTHTPGHAIAPTLHPRLQSRFDSRWQGGGVAMIRRAALLDLESAERRAEGLAERLLDEGLAVACVGRSSRGSAAERLPAEDEAWVRIDHPGGDKAGVFRDGVQGLWRTLGIFIPVAGLIVAAVPVLELLFRLNVIDTSLVALAAYLVSHVVHGYIAVRRLRVSHRDSFWHELRENGAAVHVALASAGLVLRTGLRRLVRAVPDVLRQALRPSGEEGRQACLRTAWIGLNGLAVLAGLWHLWGAAAGWPLVAFFVVWAGFQVFHGLAMFAIDWEQRFRRWSDQRHLHVPAMLTLARGKTMACETTNFPQRNLELTLPDDPRLERGQRVRLALLPDVSESMLNAQVMELDPRARQVRLRIDDQFEQRCVELARQLRRPPPDWPAWLPGPQILWWIPGRVQRTVQRTARRLRSWWAWIARV